MKKSGKVKLEMPAESINEGFARVFSAAFAARLNPTMEEIADIKTAMSEAVTNVIVHAYPDTGGEIYITARVINGDTLEFTVKDRGVGIADIKKALEPMFTTGGDDRSGMGFTIMKNFTDKMSVTSKPGRGTTVKLQKKISDRRRRF